jgi:2-dehydropantoate 2-reductase
MKIAIIGAGAVGSLLGGLLTRAGEAVTLIGRQPQVDRLNRDGLAIAGALGNFVVRVRAAEKLDFPPDLALLAVKTHQLPDALATNAPYLTQSLVLTLQNGARADAMVGAQIDQARLYSGVVLLAATYLEPGKVNYGTAGRLLIGKPFGDPDPATVQRIADLLNKAIPTATTLDIAGAHWTKLIFNANNALPAITGLSLQELNAVSALRALSVRLMQETLTVYRAAGIVPGALPGQPVGLALFLLRLPLGLAQALPLLFSRNLGKTPMLGSTLQSIKRGDKSEIDYLNGEIVALGERTGYPTPYNAAIVDLVHQVEDQHHFLSVQQLQTALKQRGLAER